MNQKKLFVGSAVGFGLFFSTLFTGFNVNVVRFINIMQ